MSLGKSDPPTPPDYTGAARAQGASNVQTAIAQSLLNRPNEVTPYGTRSWRQTGTQSIPGAEGNPAVDIPMYESSINMTPLGQKTFDTQQRISDQLGSMAESGLGRVQGVMSSPMDMSKVPNAPNVPVANEETRRAMSAAIMERARPQMEQQRASMESDLIARGHNPQGAGYAGRMDQLGRQENDMRLAADIAGGQEQSRLFGLEASRYNMGQDARGKAIQEQAYLRSLPLNELNSLRTGAQTNMPQFSPTQAGNIGQTPIFGATQAGAQYAGDMYNAQAAQDAQMMGGLFGLGGSLAMAGAFPGIPGIGRR